MRLTLKLLIVEQNGGNSVAYLTSINLAVEWVKLNVKALGLLFTATGKRALPILDVSPGWNSSLGVLFRVIVKRDLYQMRTMAANNPWVSLSYTRDIKSHESEISQKNYCTTAVVVENTFRVESDFWAMWIWLTFRVTFSRTPTNSPLPRKIKKILFTKGPNFTARTKSFGYLCFYFNNHPSTVWRASRVGASGCRRASKSRGFSDV